MEDWIFPSRGARHEYGTSNRDNIGKHLSWDTSESAVRIMFAIGMAAIAVLTLIVLGVIASIVTENGYNPF